MAKEPSIKIFVTYKEKHEILKSDIFIPMQTGRAISTDVFDNMIGDDTGDNISSLNDYFCELSSIYWVWKNYDKIGNPDYVGFMHYRRHLSFNTTEFFNECIYGLVHHTNIDDNYLKKYCLTDDKILEIVKKNDMIVANKYDVRRINFNNVYEHYKLSSSKLHIEDYDKMLEILGKKYPSFISDAEYYNSNPYGYFTNIFVMKKNLFVDFCKWYFDILFDFYEYIKEKKYTQQEIRLYVSEWLFGIYMVHMYRQKKYSIQELQRTIIDQPNCSENITPLNGNKNAICLACDQNYASKVAVTIQSIIQNSSKVKQYEIVILSSNIDIPTKEKLLSMSQKNISIRFFDIDGYISKYSQEIFREIAHFSKAIYYRLFLPQIFRKYNKVCYLDCDLILQTDIQFLLDQNLEGKCVAVVRDTEACRLLYTEKWWQEYYFNKLNFSEDDIYFNSGVMVFDIKRCLQIELTSKCISLLSSNNDYLWPDQDVLNLVLRNDAKYLNIKWNFEWHLPIYDSNYSDHLEYSVYKEYFLASQKPSIIHYAGGIKPWNFPEYKYSELWWKYARNTCFYEELLKKLNTDINNTRSDIASLQGNIDNLRNDFSNIHFPNINNHFLVLENRLNYLEKKKKSIKIKLLFYYIISMFSFGKLYENIRCKIEKLKIK